jgi:hypothetical protein
MTHDTALQSPRNNIYITRSSPIPLIIILYASPFLSLYLFRDMNGFSMIEYSKCKTEKLSLRFREIDINYVSDKSLYH